MQFQVAIGKTQFVTNIPYSSRARLLIVSMLLSKYVKSCIYLCVEHENHMLIIVSNDTIYYGMTL